MRKHELFPRGLLPVAFAFLYSDLGKRSGKAAFDFYPIDEKGRDSENESLAFGINQLEFLGGFPY